MQAVLACAVMLVASSQDGAVLDQKTAVAELARMYREDQVDQKAWTMADDEAFSRRQAERRERVVEILGATELEEFESWHHAAMLLQHGSELGDYLLAHILSMPTGAEQMPFGRFLTAATLDRYLIFSGREQIFGTQSMTEMPTNDELDEYPAHFVPEHLRQLFDAGPPIRVRGGGHSKGGAKVPRVSELAKLQRAVDAARAREEAPEPALFASARAVVQGNAKLKAADLGAAAEVLSASNEPDDLLLAHVCAVGALFLEKKKDRAQALAGCAGSLDRWLAAVGEAPRMAEPEAGAAGPRPPVPEFVRRRFLGL